VNYEKKISFASIVCIVLIQGCASNAKVENMVVLEGKLAQNFHQEFKNSIELGSVIGGTESFWGPNVTPDLFKKSLGQSIENAGLKALSNQGKFVLNAAFSGVKSPTFALTFYAKAQVHYTLIEKKSKVVLLDETIDTQSEATFSDAFWGSDRSRLAKERTIKQNFKKLLTSFETIKF